MKEANSYHQYRILVVDDEPDILLALKIVLESNGFRTEAFSDPILALRSFIASSYVISFFICLGLLCTSFISFQHMVIIVVNANVAILLIMHYAQNRKISSLDRKYF
jgi:hypothetical protein